MVFSAQYRSIFETVGYQLAPEDGTPESDIRSAEQRLGTVAPDALRAYYLVAGRERHFNTIYNRLRPPAEWCIDQSKLIFMEENQVVVVWGVRAQRSLRLILLCAWGPTTSASIGTRNMTDAACFSKSWSCGKGYLELHSLMETSRLSRLGC